MAKDAPVILFADQDHLWTRPVRGELRRRGARVLRAASVSDLVHLAGLVGPDLVILNENLPGAAGGDLDALFSERWPQAVILRVQPPPLGALETGDPVPRSRESLLGAVAAVLPGRLSEPAAPGRDGPLVVCVDDDELFLSSLARLLARHGYRVSAFEDPERALEAIPGLAPDLAILDLVMPGMSGLDLAEEIKEAYGERIPVVMLTALTSDEDIVGGYRRGASYYITKPCEPRTILNIVDYLVGDLDAQERQLLETQL